MSAGCSSSASRKDGGAFTAAASSMSPRARSSAAPRDASRVPGQRERPQMSGGCVLRAPPTALPPRQTPSVPAGPGAVRAASLLGREGATALLRASPRRAFSWPSPLRVALRGGPGAIAPAGPAPFLPKNRRELRLPAPRGAGSMESRLMLAQWTSNDGVERCGAPASPQERPARLRQETERTTGTDFARARCACFLIASPFALPALFIPWSLFRSCSA